MPRYTDTLRDQNLRPVAGALVSVITQEGTAATLTDDDNQPLANPFPTDAYGFFAFNTTDGVYTIEYRYGARLVQRDVVQVGPSATETAVAAASNAATAVAEAEAIKASLNTPDANHSSFFGGGGNLTATGQSNAAMGESALIALTGGDANAAFGPGAGALVQGGNRNSAFGIESLANNVSGSDNAGFGRRALLGTTGDDNTAVGAEAGAGFTVGELNVAVGRNTGNSAPTGIANVFVGADAGTGGDQGSAVSNAIAIGYQATVPSSNMVVLGNDQITRTVLRGELLGSTTLERVALIWPVNDNYFAMAAGPAVEPSGVGNHGFGLRALSSVTTGITNTAFGYEALMSATTTIDNTAFGSGALRVKISGIGDSAFGKNALLRCTTGQGNTGIGDTALEHVTTGGSNTALGYSAGRDNTTGNDNVAIGAYGGGGNAGVSTTFSRCTSVGTETMNYNVTGNDNVFVGYRAGHKATSAENTSLGSESLRRIIGGGFNVGIGYFSGWRVDTGNYNVFVGHKAGEDAAQKVDAVNSIAIGAGAYTVASNQVVLGSDQITHTVLRGKVGINLGNAVPEGILHAIATTGADIVRFERTGLTTDAMFAVTSFRATKTTNMADNFGVSYNFQIEDDAGVVNNIAQIGAVRKGADNSGEFRFLTFTGGVMDDGFSARSTEIRIAPTTNIPAGGSNAFGLKMSFTDNFGVFCGSGAPTLSAAKGSLYLRSDGSGTNDRMYVNTNGGTTWIAVVTAA